jgi:hypothetical protein
VAASFLAELLKLRKRPATWILAAVLTANVLLLGYALTYVFSQGSEGGTSPGFDTDALITTLLPEQLLQTVLSQVSGIGGPVVLILVVWTLFGVFLATLFRSTALAIGLGLVYALAIEGVALSLPIEADAYETFRKFLLGENSNSLAALFGSSNEAFGVPPPLVDSGQAAWVLGAYAVGFVSLAALLMRRRDVT